MTHVFYLVRHKLRYAQYALVSIHSLLTKGQVSPAQIELSLTDKFAGTQEHQALVKTGITVSLHADAEHTNSKHQFLPRLFSTRNCDSILLLDTDTILTEDRDFLRSFEGIDSRYANYFQDINGLETFNRRAKLFDPAFNFTRPIGRKRLNSLLLATLDISFEELEAWLAISKWVHGGLHFVRKNLGWHATKALRALSWVTNCDESIVKMLRCAQWYQRSEFLWEPIDETKLPYRFSPTAFSLTEGAGLIHYAGDWYRFRNEDRRLILEQEYERIAKQYIA